MSKKFQALELLAATDRPPPCEIGRSINCQPAVSLSLFLSHTTARSPPLPTTTSDDDDAPRCRPPSCCPSLLSSSASFFSISCCRTSTTTRGERPSCARGLVGQRMAEQSQARVHGADRSRRRARPYGRRPQREAGRGRDPPRRPPRNCSRARPRRHPRDRRGDGPRSGRRELRHLVSATGRGRAPTAARGTAAGGRLGSRRPRRPASTSGRRERKRPAPMAESRRREDRRRRLLKPGHVCLIVAFFVMVRLRGSFVQDITVSCRFSYSFGSRDAPLLLFWWRESEYDSEWWPEYLGPSLMNFCPPSTNRGPSRLCNIRRS